MAPLVLEFLPSVNERAWRRAGLSCNLNPFRNQCITAPVAAGFDADIMLTTEIWLRRWLLPTRVSSECWCESRNPDVKLGKRRSTATNNDVVVVIPMLTSTRIVLFFLLSAPTLRDRCNVVSLFVSNYYEYCWSVLTWWKSEKCTTSSFRKYRFILRWIIRRP